MSREHIHLIPRSAPRFNIGPSQKPIELNALGYAGMILVRSEEEEKALLESVEGTGLLTVLERCAVPRSWGEQAVEALSAHIGAPEAS
jgi:ATP adenylyltransferase